MTLKSTRANKILRKTEKELLQTRIKSINYILDNTSQQLEECRSAQRLRECQDFVDKVGEIRFNKVKQRQLNKFNLLINRKEGNITRSNNTNSNINNLTSQSGSQINQNNLSNQISHNTSQANPRNPSPAIALLPPREGSNSPLATGHLLWEGTGLPQANSQVIGSQPTLAIAHLPPGEGSNHPLATGHLLLEGTGLPQANSQAKGSHPTLAIAHFPPGEGSNSPPATLQASGSLPSLAIAHLPPGEGSNSLPGAVHLPLEDVSTSQATTLLIHRERNSSPQSPGSTWAGQGHNPPGYVGKVIGAPRHRPTQPSQEASATSWEGNTTPTPHSRSNQGSSNEEPNPKWVINLSNKPLTPAQTSVLAKGPNFVVTPRQPPNSEYITAIEAACTKLSQQDAEELRADINRVLRSSHPPKPNLTKAQNTVLRELKGDRDCIVLTAEKRVAMVVMDKQDYINKANQLLNQNTYKVISKDPTNTFKNKLNNIKKLKQG